MNIGSVPPVMNGRRQAAHGLLSKRSAIRRGLTLGLAATFWLAATPAAQGATDTADQSCCALPAFLNSSFMASATQMLGQTFTAGITGQLDRVTLRISQQFAAGGGAVQIQSVTPSGQPNGTVLGSVLYSGVLNAAGFDFTFSQTVAVVSGSQYAIVIVPAAGSGNTIWIGTKTLTAYTGGRAWFGGTQSSTAWTGVATGMAQQAAFTTWVVGGAAQTPVQVAATSPAISVSEGGLASNSGTYADPDGDNVSVTASAGTVTKTGTSAGTWSWSQTAADEGSGQTITITANDGVGTIATTTFTTTVGSVAPTAIIAGAPASALEGSTVSLTGSATSPSAIDTAAGFAYSWTVTKNAAAYTSGAGAAFSFQPNDEGTYLVTLQATDDGLFSGTASATINGANVAPTATIVSVTPSAGLVAVSSASMTFAGHFSDPGAGDSHTITWTFGDGTSNTSSLGPSGSGDFSISHAYAKSGTYTVQLAVADDDGGVSNATTTVTVGTTPQAITDLAKFVAGYPGLNRGQRRSLLRLLSSAQRALQRGDTQGACDLLYTFLDRVQSSDNEDRRHSRDEGDTTLAGAVTAVLLSLGCTHNDQNGEHS